jgi:Na+/melibiose symporter-like transporter
MNICLLICRTVVFLIISAFCFFSCCYSSVRERFSLGSMTSLSAASTDKSSKLPSFLSPSSVTATFSLPAFLFGPQKGSNRQVKLSKCTKVSKNTWIAGKTSYRCTLFLRLTFGREIKSGTYRSR